jgi:hypothetical protein
MTKSLFLRNIQEFIITRRFAKRTIETYIYWIKRYIVFNNKQHPSKLGNKDKVTRTATQTYELTQSHDKSYSLGTV